MMSYERLDMYQCSIKFLIIAHGICNDFPRGHASLANQIRRASVGIPLCIGEGAGKRTKADCRRFFDIAHNRAGFVLRVIADALREPIIVNQRLGVQGHRKDMDCHEYLDVKFHRTKFTSVTGCKFISELHRVPDPIGKAASATPAQPPGQQAAPRRPNYHRLRQLPDRFPPTNRRP